MTKMSKKGKIRNSGALFARIQAQKTFHKNWPPSLFSIYSPVKSEKTNEPILRKNLNEQTNERTNAGEIIKSSDETGRSDRSKKQCTSKCIDNCSEIFV